MIPYTTAAPASSTEGDKAEDPDKQGGSTSSKHNTNDSLLPQAPQPIKVDGSDFASYLSENPLEKKGGKTKRERHLARLRLTMKGTV
jgi:hypothetical protein